MWRGGCAHTTVSQGSNLTFEPLVFLSMSVTFAPLPSKFIQCWLSPSLSLWRCSCIAILVVMHSSLQRLVCRAERRDKCSDGVGEHGCNNWNQDTASEVEPRSFLWMLLSGAQRQKGLTSLLWNTCRKVHISVHRLCALYMHCKWPLVLWLHLCHQWVITLTNQNTKGGCNKVEKGRGIIFFMKQALTRLLSIPGLASPASHASLEICLAANTLWKALISYLGSSSMHQDNKPYLISLCSLMSQLKGLVLPLAMGLAERIVCRLVNTGLWRSWSTFKMLVLSNRRSCVRTLADWLPPAFLCQMAGVPRNGW